MAKTSPRLLGVTMAAALAAVPVVSGLTGVSLFAASQDPAWSGDGVATWNISFGDASTNCSVPDAHVTIGDDTYEKACDFAFKINDGASTALDGSYGGGKVALSSGSVGGYDEVTGDLYYAVIDGAGDVAVRKVAAADGQEGPLTTFSAASLGITPATIGGVDVDEGAGRLVVTVSEAGGANARIAFADTTGANKANYTGPTAPGGGDPTFRSDGSVVIDTGSALEVYTGAGTHDFGPIALNAQHGWMLRSDDGLLVRNVSGGTSGLSSYAANGTLEWGPTTLGFGTGVGQQVAGDPILAPQYGDTTHIDVPIVNATTGAVSSTTSIDMTELLDPPGTFPDEVRVVPTPGPVRFDGAGNAYVGVDQGVAKLDNTFAVDPAWHILNVNDVVDLAVKANGKVRIFASYYTGQLATDGTIDHAYAALPLSAGTNDYAQDGFVAPDGKLVVVGYRKYRTTDVAPQGFNAARFNTNGTLDYTTNALTIPTTAQNVTIAGVDSAGRAYITYTDGGNRHTIRVDNTGTEDTTWDTDGVLDLEVLGVTAGDDLVARNASGAVVRVNNDGTADTSVPALGTVDDGTTLDFAEPVAGTYVLCTTTGCAKFSASTTVNDYSTDGLVDLTALGAGAVADATVGNDGAAVVRLTGPSATKLIDGTTGAVSTFAAAPANATFLAHRSEGFLSVDATGPQVTIKRFHFDGTLDTSFGSSGTDTSVSYAASGADFAVAGNLLYVLDEKVGPYPGFDVNTSDVRVARLTVDAGTATTTTTSTTTSSTTTTTTPTTTTAPTTTTQPSSPEPGVEPLPNPERFLDTRTGGLTPWSAGEARSLQISGKSGVPANATAVAVNVTAVNPQAPGYVTVYPCGEPRPTASNVNYQVGENTPNMVIVKIGENGQICVFSEQATDIIADVTGYFGPDSPFVSFNPTRVLDTRNTAARVNYSGDKPAAGATVEVDVTNGTSVPANASGVVVNVTGTEATDAGYVTVWPCGQAMPTASNLNLEKDGTRANLVVSKLGTSGKICLFTERGTNLIVDVAGYFPAASNYTAVVPERILETRTGAGQLGYTGAKPVANQTVTLKVAGVGLSNVPANASAVVLNVTGTEATADGFVTVWPCDQPRPNASNLNLYEGKTAPNLVITKMSAQGTVCLYTETGTHLIADVAGYFPATVS